MLEQAAQQEAQTKKKEEDRKLAFDKLERKLSTFPKQESESGENVLSSLSKPLDYLLSASNLPSSPAFMGLVGETTLWANKSQ